jgi:DegV family protein with EDD domain
MATRLVTDSTADIPASYATALGIGVVPCEVYLGEEVFQDGVDLAPEEFYQRVAEATGTLRTAQPPVRAFLELYQSLLDGEESVEIVSVHVAGNLSGTVNAAWAAAQMLPDPSVVHVVDSGQLSMGLGLGVIEAARLAQTGATAARIVADLQVLLSFLRTAAVLDTVENLYAGGRISQVSAALATALQIKPLLSVRDGEVSVWGRVRTRARALRRLVAYVREWGPLSEMAIMHTGAPDLAGELATSLRDLAPKEQPLILPAGAALTSHLGLRALGVCALVEAPD